ncbi:MAG: hypothetical protein NZ853_06205 [Leptospiraceae bacterium]|nr:hypothetical protein [Leptospiraceae bacterium]MDW7976456.1 hypothetical protein [Leptospiraceae bacterium]
MKQLILFLLLVSSLTLTWGQQRQTITTEERIRILEEEIEKLRGEKAAKEYKSYQGFSPAASGVYFVEEGLTWGGYGEIKYRNFKNPYRVDQSDVHRFVLYAGYKFNDWILLNAEIEYVNSGFRNADNIALGGTYTGTVSGNQASVNINRTTRIQEGNVFVEFAYIDFLFTESFQVAAGLHLVPSGITNILHEPTTFYTVERPYTETFIIPSTWRELGVMFHGKLLNDLVLYKVAVLNGLEGNQISESTWINPARPRGSLAKTDHLAYVAYMDVFPIEGLTIGGSYYIGGAGQKDLEKVDVFSRLDFSKIPLPPEVNAAGAAAPIRTIASRVFEFSRKINPIVRIGEGHLRFEKDAWFFQALMARGWIDEEGVRAINAKTNRNIGSTVEGAYGIIGFDIASLFNGKYKTVIFYKNEYVNTQKRTLRNNGQLFIETEIAKELNNAAGIPDLFRLTNVTPSSVGFRNSISGAEVRTELEKYGIYGLPDPVNNRRIQTIGIAFYPHPNVSIKLDYEDWKATSHYYQDNDLLRPANNNGDIINAAVTFIF